MQFLNDIVARGFFCHVSEIFHFEEVMETILKLSETSQERQIFLPLFRLSPAAYAFKEMTVEHHDERIHLFDRNLSHRERSDSTKRHFSCHDNIHSTEMFLCLFLV